MNLLSENLNENDVTFVEASRNQSRSLALNTPE